MGRTTLSFAVALWFSMSAVYAAEDAETEPDARVRQWINEQTILVGRLDLVALDAESLGKQWLEPLSTTDEERKACEAVMKICRKWHDRLKVDGVTDAYIITTMGYPKLIVYEDRTSRDHVERGILLSTYIVLPGASDETIAGIQKVFSDHWKSGDEMLVPECRRIKGAAVIGMKPLLDELNSLKSSARPEFAAAIKAVSGKPAWLTLVPPPIFARAAKEILLDPIPGGDSPLGPIVADGIRWIAFGIDPNTETFKADLIIQSADAESAKLLASTVKQGIHALAQDLPSSAVGTMVNAAQFFSLLPNAHGDRLVWSLDATQMKALRALAEVAYRKTTAEAVQRRSSNNLLQIALALANYHDKQKHFPDRAIRDKDGKPLLSWRVAILAEVEEYNLYKQFHLDEPWDSEHNLKLIERMPAAFKDPAFGKTPPGYTRYLAAVGKNLAFPPDGPISFKEFTDGTSKTIMIIEVPPARAVIWTKPDDLEVDLDHPTRGLFHDGKFLAGFADGHVETHTDAVDPKGIRAMFTRNSGDAIDYEKLYPKK